MSGIPHDESPLKSVGWFMMIFAILEYIGIEIESSEPDQPFIDGGLEAIWQDVFDTQKLNVMPDYVKTHTIRWPGHTLIIEIKMQALEQDNSDVDSDV